MSVLIEIVIAIFFTSLVSAGDEVEPELPEKAGIEEVSSNPVSEKC